jgi:hypothetical protein
VISFCLGEGVGNEIMIRRNFGGCGFVDIYGKRLTQADSLKSGETVVLELLRAVLFIGLFYLMVYERKAQNRHAKVEIPIEK